MHLSKENRDTKLRVLYRAILRKLGHPVAGSLIVGAGLIVMTAAIAVPINASGWTFIGGITTAVLGLSMLAITAAEHD